MDLGVWKGSLHHPFGYPGKRWTDFLCSIFGLTMGVSWLFVVRSRDVLGRGDLNERSSQESQIRHVDQRQLYLSQFRGASEPVEGRESGYTPKASITFCSSSCFTSVWLGGWVVGLIREVDGDLLDEAVLGPDDDPWVVLILRRSIERSGCGWSETVSCSIRRALSNSRFRAEICSIRSCRCSVLASTRR